MSTANDVRKLLGVFTPYDDLPRSRYDDLWAGKLVVSHAQYDIMVNPCSIYITYIMRHHTHTSAFVNTQKDTLAHSFTSPEPELFALWADSVEPYIDAKWVEMIRMRAESLRADPSYQPTIS